MHKQRDQKAKSIMLKQRNLTMHQGDLIPGKNRNFTTTWERTEISDNMWRKLTRCWTCSRTRHQTQEPRREQEIRIKNQQRHSLICQAGEKPKRAPRTGARQVDWEQREKELAIFTGTENEIPANRRKILGKQHLWATGRGQQWLEKSLEDEFWLTAKLDQLHKQDKSGGKNKDRPVEDLLRE
jgi:hypothetical protein